MYRCQLCGEVSGPGQQRLTHVVKRPDGQITREIPVCRVCHAETEKCQRPLVQVIQKKAVALQVSQGRRNLVLPVRQRDRVEL